MVTNSPEKKATSSRAVSSAMFKHFIFGCKKMKMTADCSLHCYPVGFLSFQKTPKPSLGCLLQMCSKLAAALVWAILEGYEAHLSLPSQKP